MHMYTCTLINISVGTMVTQGVLIPRLIKMVEKKSLDSTVCACAN